ncbi:MAG: tRNA (uridine(54)-C5)-methyltransferase TrmA [Congregibacter sp.]
MLRPWETAPEQYRALFDAKCDTVEPSFAALGAPPAERLASPTDGYRVRAEFRVWHSGDELSYVMFDPAAPRDPVIIDSFLPALPVIRELMPPLRTSLKSNPILRRKLFQLEFMATTTGELLLTLIYHRALEADWESEAKALAERFSIAIVGRSRKQKVVIGRDYVTDEFTVDGRRYRYRQYEQAFVQPNGPVNAKMLAWACEQAGERDDDHLELYCGNGNFTLPFAARFRRVLATELSKSGTRASQENIAANGVDNVFVARLSAEEVSEAIAGTREFRRLQTLPEPLDSYQLNTVFVDPPRAGLDEATLRCVQGFERILYISCNPATLLDNLSALHASHRIERLAFFDQFPYTPHLECGVLLERR